MADRVVKLSRVLKTHQGDKNELTIREPTARDFIAMRKLPFNYLISESIRATDDPQAPRERKLEPQTDFELVLRWLERLTGVEIMILETLKAADVISLTNELRGILGETDVDQTKDNKVDDQVKN